MVVLAVLACLRETRPGLAHEAKGQPDFPGRSTALTETAKSFRGFARSRGRHADSGFAVSRELGVNSPFLSSNACAMIGDLLLKNAVDASAVAFWRKGDKNFWCRGGPVGRGLEACMFGRAGEVSLSSEPCPAASRLEIRCKFPSSNESSL
jgi:hypothetical protein